jgi:manganese/iron transport system substrate-binding protein
MCSTTQVADFTRQIVGEDWEVICVLGPGQDPHTYEVGNDDLLAVQRADLCLHNGWNLEGHDWMRVLAENAGKPLVTCTSNVTLLRVESEDGVQDVKDPHAWFDVERAMIYVQNILAGIQHADPDRAKQYQDRADAYLLKLRELDCWIREQVNSIPRNRRILVTHHDAFRYFCNAYGFQAISPMSWTTGELTDVTIEQRQAIIRKIRDLGIKSLFVESTINRELLDGIAKDAGISIGGELYSDAMGAAGTRGETYMGMMQHNVEMMVKHLR